MLTSSCRRKCSRSTMKKEYHIYCRLVICIMPLGLEWLQCVLVKPSLPSAKAINPRRTSHRSALHSAPTAPNHTRLAVTTALYKMPSARAVPKKVTGMQSATALVLLANIPLSPMELRRPPSSALWKGEES